MKSYDDLSVLLLEDEYLIALDGEQILQSLGFKRIEIANTLEGAAKIAETGGIDLAILDLNIDGKMSYGVADMFRRRQTPVVFASGYEMSHRSVPELENGVYLKKPYTSESFKDAVHTALARSDAQ